MLGLRNRDKENEGNEEGEHISWLGVVDGVSSRTEMTGREKREEEIAKCRCLVGSCMKCSRKQKINSVRILDVVE